MTKPTNEISEYLASLGRKGGKARLIKIAPSKRKAIARKAAQARWGQAQKHNGGAKGK